MAKKVNLQDGKVEVTPLDTTKKTLIQLSALSASVILLGDKNNQNVQAVEDALNTVHNTIDSLGLLSKEERESILKTMEAFKNADNTLDATMLRGLDTIADRVNQFQVTESFTAPFNTEGAVDVKLDYDFADKSEFSIVLTKENAGGKTVEINYSKVDKATVRITAIDTAYPVENQHPYDATVDGASFDITGVITFKPADISFVITDEDGVEHTVGK